MLTALESLDKLVDEKWLSAYGMNDAIKTKIEGSKLDAAIKRFYNANREWGPSAQHPGIDFKDRGHFPVWHRRPEAWMSSSIDCQTYALKGLQPNGSDPVSVGVLLEIAYHCHNKIKGKIDEQLRARDQNKAIWPATIAEPDPAGLALSHIWWVDKVLQCMMVERALELRQQSPRVPSSRSEGAEPARLYDQRA